MSSIAVPASIPVRRRIPWVLALVVSLTLVAIVWLIAALAGRSGGGVVAGQYYRVVPMDMDIIITKDGELQAVNNVEIVCLVEGGNTILDIAKEGAFVHKGDVVCKIDSSEIETKIESAQLDLQRAEADLTTAKETKEIQESSNVANYEAANVDLILAKLDLQEYVEGTYPSSLQQATTALEMAKIEVKNKEDDLDQTRNLFGKGFVTAVMVKDAEIALLKVKNDLAQKETALLVLQKYTHEKALTDRKNDVAQADKKLARVQRENASSMAQRQAELRSREETLAVRKRQMEHLQEQLANCVIQAPQDGMVVYASSGGGGWGRRETPIQPGASVRWQEMLIRLPDTSAMKAVCKINEAQVSKLKLDPTNPLRATVKLVGQPNLQTAWLSNISIMADGSQRFWNADSKEYPVDVRFDVTPAGLKPGMTAEEVKIYIDRLHNVLAVPVGAVYAAGEDNYVFVRADEGPKPVKVKLGQVNETHAQVAEGVTQGQQVLILQSGQGRELLEKAGIKIVMPAATTQPFDGKPPVIPPTENPPPKADAEGGGNGSRERSSRHAPAAGSGDGTATSDANSMGGAGSSGSRGGGSGSSRGEGGGRRSRGESSGGGPRPPR